MIDRGEADHARCVEALAGLTAPMVTTWPAFTEAIYLVGGAGGWKAQEAMWKLLERGDLQLVAAEALDVARIFILDRDFQVYRWMGRKKFEVIP